MQFECPTCGQLRECTFQANGPHMMARCSACGTFYKNLSKREREDTLRQPPVPMPQETATAYPTFGVVGIFAANWLAQVESPTADDIRKAVQIGRDLKSELELAS